MAPRVDCGLNVVGNEHKYRLLQTVHATLSLPSRNESFKSLLSK